MVIGPCDSTKNVFIWVFIIYQLPLCVRFYLVTEQNTGSCQDLEVDYQVLLAKLRAIIGKFPIGNKFS